MGLAARFGKEQVEHFRLFHGLQGLGTEPKRREYRFNIVLGQTHKVDQAVDGQGIFHVRFAVVKTAHGAREFAKIGICEIFIVGGELGFELGHPFFKGRHFGGFGRKGF